MEGVKYPMLSWTASILEKVPGGPAFLATPDTVYRDQAGMYHTTSRCSESSSPSPLVEVASTYGALARGDVPLCWQCPWGDLLRHIDPRFDDVARRAYSTLCGPVVGNDQAGRWSHAHQTANGTAMVEEEARGGSEVTVAFAEHVVAMFRDDVDRIREGLRSSEAIEATLAECRERLGGSDYALDDDLVLIGTRRDERHGRGSLVCHQFSIREDDSWVVICVPRYLADDIRPMLIDPTPTVAIRDANADVLEATAALWEPTGAGPLRSLRAALDTAFAVTG